MFVMRIAKQQLFSEPSLANFHFCETKGTAHAAWPEDTRRLAAECDHFRMFRRSVFNVENFLVLGYHREYAFVLALLPLRSRIVSIGATTAAVRLIALVSPATNGRACHVDIPGQPRLLACSCVVPDA